MRSLLHLTDLHVAAEGEPRHGGPSPLRALALIMDELERSAVRPGAIVLSGDLADDAEPGAYARIRELLAPVAERLGAPLVVCAGNHDDRAALRASGLGATGDGAGDEPIDHVVRLPGPGGDLRVLVLDSTVPGLVRGELDDAQLAWAAEELATPASAGTVVILHHAPMPSPVGLDGTRLRRPEALAGLLRGTDARIVLCGHSHHGSAGGGGGVPVWMGPALASVTDVLPPPDSHRARTNVGATRIDLGDGWTQANPIVLGGTVLSESRLSAVERSIAEHDEAASGH